MSNDDDEMTCTA